MALCGINGPCANGNDAWLALRQKLQQPRAGIHAGPGRYGHFRHIFGAVATGLAAHVMT